MYNNLMKLIIGLGNPEPEYTGTRHNVGKDILNEFIEIQDFGNWKENSKLGIDFIQIPQSGILAKPHSYMNEVGNTVSKVCSFFKIDPVDVAVIYDELDLVVGEYKFAYDKGSRIHNGIRSIKDVLDQKPFWHLRVGVRDESIPMSVQKTGMDPAKYVLSKFNLSDRNNISTLNRNIITPILNDFLSKK